MLAAWNVIYVGLATRPCMIGLSVSYFGERGNEMVASALSLSRLLEASLIPHFQAYIDGLLVRERAYFEAYLVYTFRVPEKFCSLVGLQSPVAKVRILILGHVVGRSSM